MTVNPRLIKNPNTAGGLVSILKQTSQTASGGFCLADSISTKAYVNYINSSGTYNLEYTPDITLSTPTFTNFLSVTNSGLFTFGISGYTGTHFINGALSITKNITTTTGDLITNNFVRCNYIVPAPSVNFMHFYDRTGSTKLGGFDETGLWSIGSYTRFLTPPMSYGAVCRSAFGNNVPLNGTVDLNLNTWANGYAGHLYVTGIYAGNIWTVVDYFVAARGTDAPSVTTNVIKTGSGGSVAFGVSFPSANVIRVTANSGGGFHITMAFFGAEMG